MDDDSLIRGGRTSRKVPLLSILLSSQTNPAKQIQVVGFGRASGGNKDSVSVTVTITGIIAVSDVISGSPCSVDPSDRCWSWPCRVWWRNRCHRQRLLATLAGRASPSAAFCTENAHVCVYVWLLSVDGCTWMGVGGGCMGQYAIMVDYNI